MKHHDCTCAECRPRKPAAAARPTARITIPIADMPAVIAESLRAVLAAHDLGVCKVRPAWVEMLNTAELEDLLREAGNNTAAALQGLDETLLELPAPVAIRRARK